jgi:hypothetical protein
VDGPARTVGLPGLACLLHERSEMYPAKDARDLSNLLRLSRDLDVVGDLTATVDSPSEILAWALVLARPHVLAWRSVDSGHRYLQVSAERHRAPIRGTVTAVLACEAHQEFWSALGLDDLAPGDRRSLETDALTSAWAAMPVTPAATGQSPPPRPPQPEPA